MIFLLVATAMFATIDEPVERLSEYETYLASHKLDSVMVAHLHSQLQSAPAQAKGRLAERLGRLYVKQLAAANDPAVRQHIEERAKELLRSVPDAELWDLKLDLAKATYLKAEEIGERYRLRMTSDAEKFEALRVLASVEPTFAGIANKVGARVDQLERREGSLRGEELESLRQELGTARRLRSLSHYYSGWTAYYTAELTGNKQGAADAMVAFGYLLNAAPGKAPNVERLAKPMLKYDHVSRAAIGCAMVASIRGKDTEALRWIEAIEGTDDLPQAIATQLVDRKLMILARADRWADVETVVRQLRGTGKLLSVSQARLLAVLTLDPIGDAARPSTMDVRSAMGKLALGDLVAQGEVGHVLDLVQRFGVDLIGDDGFVVRYVRALQAFDRARDAHRAAGNADDPTADPGIINRYRESIRLLDAVASAEDAAKFSKDAAAAVMKAGLASYYVSDFITASERFERASAKLASAIDQREALWFAVVALDRAVDGGNAKLLAERDRVALLYLERFPQSENAGKLVLRRAGVLSDEKAVALLLNISKDTPLYAAARREAARLLFTVYRKAGPQDKEFAAARFLETADETLDADRALVSDGKMPAAKEAGDRLIVRLRQVAEVALASRTPDLRRAERAIGMLDELSKNPQVDGLKLVEELAYRKVQLELARGDFEGAVRAHDSLRAGSGPYAAGAERAIFKASIERFRAAQDNADLAMQVVLFGKRVLAEPELMKAPESEPVRASVTTAVAQAAAMIFYARSDPAMRDLAIELDGKRIAGGVQTLESLKRFAVLSESAARTEQALEAWRSLLASAAPGSSDWFEARYESLRVLAMSDRSAAEQVLDQHVTLYPEFGPDPWGPKLRKLKESLRSLPKASAKPGSGGAQK